MTRYDQIELSRTPVLKLLFLLISMKHNYLLPNVKRLSWRPKHNSSFINTTTPLSQVRECTLQIKLFRIYFTKLISSFAHSD